MNSEIVTDSTKTLLLPLIGCFELALGVMGEGRGARFFPQTMCPIPYCHDIVTISTNI